MLKFSEFYLVITIIIPLLSDIFVLSEPKLDFCKEPQDKTL